VYPVSIDSISEEQVKTALRTVEGLRWLATRDDAVAALRNMKTLAWVVQASSQFHADSTDLTSLPALVDRIWKFWTDRQFAYQGLLMRLGEREAEFARSFSLSELETTDQQLLDRKPSHLPIREVGRNRIGFEHDLAADWARFQRLTEIADDIGRWAPLAGKPLWGGALRLLGQLLLRQTSDGGNAWQRALTVVEARGELLAADVLLDALCLDPQAGRFLDQHAELLFANHGQLLIRLLRRFVHIASVPSASEELVGLDRSLSLYLEAKFRTPIYGLWPPVAAFLRANLDRVANLVSPTVAEVCELWLTTTPLQLNGRPTLFRRDLAEVALATARAVQVEHAKGTIFDGEGERHIFSAALLAARDLPDEVADWALQMTQRRRPSEELAKRIAAARRTAELQHAERSRVDPQAQAHRGALARRAAHFPSIILRPRKLPQWPLGPFARVERDFRQVVLHSPALRALMEVRPHIAAEVLLASLIEESPTDEHSELMRLEKVGLQHDEGNSYPTAFWKSPFFQFFQAAPDTAVTSLIQLVNFATERWTHEWQRRDRNEPPSVVLALQDGTRRTYIGDPQVFDWTQANSNFIGQLHCALNAAERWLTAQIDAGSDIEPHLYRILAEGSSLALIGLLINVAKYRAALLAGPLLPLLGSEELYWLDHCRVQNAQFNFDAFNWARSGEAMFNLAKEWTSASYRQRSLQEVVGDLLPHTEPVSAALKVAISSWSKPDEPKAAVEFAALCARLDAANYSLRQDAETGEEITEFALPEAVARQIAAFQETSQPALGRLLLPSQCEQALQSQGRLSETSAQMLATVLHEHSSVGEDTVSAGVHEINRLAAAATLVTCARGWLELHPEVSSTAKSVLRVAVDRIDRATAESKRPEPWDSDDGLRFVAYGIYALWREDGNAEAGWERCVLKVLTSGDYRAAAVLGKLAHRDREELGAEWWRVLQLAVLWSALSMLRPEFEDRLESVRRWDRWVRWLRARRVGGETADASSFQPLAIWRRLQRIERLRWHRAFAEGHARFRRPPDERVSRGLEFSFLGAFLSWLLADTANPRVDGIQADCHIILALWSYEAAYCSERLNERGEYPLPGRFGYDLVGKMAFYAARAPADRARELWRAVLELGPAARHIIEHFAASWFINAQHSADAPMFAQRWRDMVKFALDAEWKKGGYWFDEQRILQKLLGFGSEVFLKSQPHAPRIVAEMREFYHQWARANLQRDEENIAAFANFLASDAGSGLRVDGLRWLASAIGDLTRAPYRRDSKSVGDSLLGLLDSVLRENATALRSDQSARDALVSVAAYLAAKQLPEALALQERIKNFK
jgi:hypothetical protein